MQRQIESDCPIYLTPEFQEHNPNLIELNVGRVDLSWSSQYRGGEEIENEDVLFTLEKLKWEVTRLANGRINNSTLDRIKKMFGGWHILPFYGLADRHQIDYFRFKPDNSPADWKKPGKVQKYLGAVGESPKAYCPNVPEAIWAVISCRYAIEKTGDNFWEWILDHPEIPVIITEGEKKAFSGLGAGYAVLSLPGIDSGYKSSSDNDDGSGSKLSLIPDLEALATSGRTIYIAFDRDSNPQTVKRVQKARQKLARLFGELGCETLSIKWDVHYKGLDDFVLGAGQDALDSAIESAQDITHKISEDSEEKGEKIPSALEMSKKVFKDLFENVIRFDASVKQYWCYDGKGKWVNCSDEYIFGTVQEYLEEAVSIFSPSYVRNVIEFAKKDFLHEGWTEASNLLYIPFTNGVLELKTGQLLPYSPDYGFTWQLPRPYSAIEANWGSIDKFLKTFTNNNQQLNDIAIAFCNAVLTGRADLQKFLYLFGSGANGKGAFMGLLSMLVGKENTHSTTIAELNESRFESANLMNKRLVLMTDEDKRVGGLSVFKSATGQDPIRYERKGKDATNFIFKGMFVIAANSPTFVGDSSFAIKRRKVDFPCLARIPENERRDMTPEFEADLTAFTTYLLSLADESVTANIRGAGSVAAVKQLNWEMTVREDSIAAFFSEKLIVDPNGLIACGKLYKEYQVYCEESGLRPKSVNNFTPSLIELCNDSLGHSIAHQHTKTGKVIKGLRLCESWEGEEEIIQTSTDEKCLSSLLHKNLNFSPDLKKPSPPSPDILGAGLKVVTKPSPAVTPVTDSTKDLNHPKEPEIKADTDENGNLTGF
ncbi:MAG: phage/plasmid primase, P4 family [Chamaesiphon sp.]|nr:phage/plasmid primase, P4 family [Chamaesiphon sp.]